MTFNPLDVMRTQEATQLKHIEAQRFQHAQEQISKNFQTMVEREQIKPKETTKSDNPEYRYDAKEKGKNQYNGSGSNKKGKKEEEKKASKPASKSGGFDVLI